MVQVADSLMTIGILNREGDVLPPESNSAAMLEEATQSTIVPLERK